MQTHQADVLVLVLYSGFFLFQVFQLHTVNDMIYSEAEGLQSFLQHVWSRYANENDEKNK